MTCAEIITRARDLSDTAGTAFYSQAEEFASLNESYRDIYEQILQSDDDYFLDEWTFLFSELTPVANQERAYTIALPADFYRLRVLQYRSGNQYRAVEKFAPRNEAQGATQPTYRIRGDGLKLILPAMGTYPDFRAAYYPKPAVYDDPENEIDFPPQLEAAIIAYQIAIDIRRKQDGEYGKLSERRGELWTRFVAATQQRDNWSYETLGNVYRTTETPWR